MNEQTTMRFVVMFLWLLMVSFPLYSQERGPGEIRMSADFENASILEVMEVVKEKTALDFLCNHNELRHLPLITKQFREQTVDDILRYCLKGSGFEYRYVRGVIVITRKDPPHPVGTTITGQVLDAGGIPLPGATVVIKGRYEGTATDAGGRFTIHTVSPGEIWLTVSFVGMKTRLIQVEQPGEVLIRLEEDKKNMEEVVVTGYGNISKSGFTGNSITVRGSELQRVSKSDVLSALQVFDPSFHKLLNNQWGSDPNMLPEIYIRGRSGIGVTELSKEDLTRSAPENNSNLPTFILDGFQVNIQKVYDLDPARIESITILKDAAATAMYGSRAANGVVVITSIVPGAGRVNVSYNFAGDVAVPDLSGYNLMDAAEKIEVERLAGMFEPTDGYTEIEGITEYNNKMKQLAKGVNTYWLSKPLRTAFNHRHSLYVDGGTERLRVGIDFTYHDESGVMKGSFRNRLGGGFYADYRVGRFQVRNYISYLSVKSEESPYGTFGDYARQLPYDEYLDGKGNYLPVLRSWHSAEPRVNPLYESGLKSFSRASYEEIIDNLHADLMITDDLHVRGEFSLIKRTMKKSDFVDPKSRRAENLSHTLKGYLERNAGENPEWNANVLVFYNRNLGKHHLNLSAGINARSAQTESTTTAYRGFPSGELHSPDYAMEIEMEPTTGETTKRLFGVLGRLNYTYDHIYLLDLAGRLDGSSEFGENRRFAPFWSVGVGVNVHNYKWFGKSRVLDRLKVRGSFGQTGKVDFPAYCAVSKYEVSLEDIYKTGAGVLLKALGNPDLKWERTNTLDVGMEVSLWDGMVELNATFYNKRTVDLITDVTISASSGFPSYKDNLGGIRNRGIEIFLRSRLVNRADWMVSVHGNLAHNRNSMLRISDALEDYNRKVDAYYEGYTTASKDVKYTKPLMKYQEGGSLTSIWGMKSLGIDPSTGQEMFLTRAGTMTHAWDSREQVIIGDTEPDARGSFGFYACYKNWSLAGAFLYEFGGQRYNETLVQKVENANLSSENADRRILSDRWQKPGDKTWLKDIRDASMTRPTSRFCQDYNVVSLSSLTLGYELRADWIRRFRMNRLKLEIGANDVFRISSVEEERGIAYPFARGINFALKASF